MTWCNGLIQPGNCLDSIWKSLLPLGGNSFQEGTNIAAPSCSDLLTWLDTGRGYIMELFLLSRFNHTEVACLASADGGTLSAYETGTVLRQCSARLYHEVTRIGEADCEISFRCLQSVCRALQPTRTENGVLEIEGLRLLVVIGRGLNTCLLSKLLV